MTQKGRVAPFGDPRIKGCSPLPAAFRSVPRPSSPLSAKASTKCPYALDPMRFRRTQRADPPHAASTPRLILSTSLLPAWPKPRIPPPRALAQGRQSLANGQSHSYPQCQRSRRQRSQDRGQMSSPARSRLTLAYPSDKQAGSGGAEASTPSALVEPTGIEPVTPCLQSRCSPS